MDFLPQGYVKYEHLIQSKHSVCVFLKASKPY